MSHDRRRDEAAREDAFARANDVRTLASQCPALGLEPLSLQLQSGDVLTLQTKRHLTVGERFALRRAWELLAEPRPLVVLEDGVQLEVFHRTPRWLGASPNDDRRACIVRVNATLYFNGQFAHVPLPDGCTVTAMRPDYEGGHLELMIVGDSLPPVLTGEPLPYRTVMVSVQRDDDGKQHYTSELVPVAL